MKFRRIVNKIAALGVGAVIIGSTLVGAASINLSDYPAPFIQDGNFAGNLVVGDKADAMDIIGITDIAMSLQYAATKTVSVGTGGAPVIDIGDGVKIDKSSSHLNIDEDIADIYLKLDDDELPDILTDETYDDDEGDNKGDVDYTQEIRFNTGTGTVIFTQDDDDAPDAADYLFFSDDSGVYAYTYVLDFEGGVDYDSTEVDKDFISTQIDIQGHEYTITDVKVDTSGNIDKLYLQAGDTTMWLEEGVTSVQQLNGDEHEITLVDVSEGGESCGIKVDGTLQWMDKGETKTINGVDIGVIGGIAIHSAAQDNDMCEVNLGATDLILEDGSEVVKNGEDIDGSEVTFDSSGTLPNMQLNSITISFIPEDDIYLAEGKSWVDPILGNFEITYAGLTTGATEEMQLTTTSNDAEFEVYNNDGKQLEIPFYYDDGSGELTLGTGIDDGDLFLIDNELLTSSTDITSFEGLKILKVSANGEAHIVEISDIKLDTLGVGAGNGEITIEDVTYGGEETTYDIDMDSGLPVSVELPDGTLTMAFDLSTSTIDITDVNLYSPSAFETKREAEIFLAEDVDGDYYNIEIYEDPDYSNDDGAPNNQVGILINLLYDGTANELKIVKPDVDSGTIEFHAEDEDNDDDQIAMTLFGTRIEYDEQNDDDLKIIYSEDEAVANVFVSKTGADVSTVSEGGIVESVQIQRIEVGTTRLASEVSNVLSKNLILVGGPCANAATSTVLGDPRDCTEGFEEGVGIIELIQHDTGNYALIVAGYSAEDTRNAANVLASLDHLDGTKFEVRGTEVTKVE